MTTMSILLFANLAIAGSVNFDFRTDYRSQNFNDAALTAGAGKNNSSILVQTGRVDFNAKLNEDTGFRLRWRFAGKNQGNVDKRDSTNSTLDFAYVSHKMNDMFSLVVGKYASEVGGYEGTTSGADLYLLSEAYAGTTGLGGSAFHAYGTSTTTTTSAMGLTGFAPQLYTTGVKAALALGDHELNFQASNADAGAGRSTATAGSADVTDNSKFAQSSPLSGVVFKGNFMDKTLGFMASYHTQKTSSLGGTLDSKANWTAAGFQYKFWDCALQLDYLLNSYTGIVGTTNPNDKITSIVANFRHTFNDNWVAGLKYVSSEESVDTATGSATVASFKNTYTSYGAVAEYKPKKEDMFRYHLAYNSRTMKPDATVGSDSRTMQEIIAGVRINADFLK